MAAGTPERWDGGTDVPPQHPSASMAAEAWGAEGGGEGEGGGGGRQARARAAGEEPWTAGELFKASNAGGLVEMAQLLDG